MSDVSRERGRDPGVDDISREDDFLRPPKMELRRLSRGSVFLRLDDILRAVPGRDGASASLSPSRVVGACDEGTRFTLVVVSVYARAKKECRLRIVRSAPDAVAVLFAGPSRADRACHELATDGCLLEVRSDAERARGVGSSFSWMRVGIIAVAFLGHAE